MLELGLVVAEVYLLMVNYCSIDRYKLGVNVSGYNISMLPELCDSGGVGLRTQSPSSSEFISISPAPAGALRGPAASFVSI